MMTHEEMNVFECLDIPVKFVKHKSQVLDMATQMNNWMFKRT